MNIRIGNGYDIHRLVPGRPLILGGQTLEHPAGLGLDGHSDADVLVHAIMDALLGALSLGDIGKYFPPTDPKWKGADSLELLEQVMGLVRERGWSVVTPSTQPGAFANYVDQLCDYGDVDTRDLFRGGRGGPSPSSLRSRRRTTTRRVGRKKSRRDRPTSRRGSSATSWWSIASGASLRTSACS